MKKVIIAIAVCTFALHAQGTGQVQAPCACTEVNCKDKPMDLVQKAKTIPQKSAATIIAWYQDFSEKSTQDLNKAFGECADKKSTQESDKSDLMKKTFMNVSIVLDQFNQEKDLWKVIPIEIRGEIDKTIGYPLIFEVLRIVEDDKYSVEQLHQAMLPLLSSLATHVRDLLAKYGLIA